MNIYNPSKLLKKALYPSQIQFKNITKINRYYLTQITKQLNFTSKFYQVIYDKLANIKPNSFLRLQIFAGEGCEGFKYKFKFDDKINENKDYVKFQSIINNQGQLIRKILFAVNQDQIKLVKGSTIDYAQEMMREVFYVKQNPNAQIQCSCKTSFSPKQGLL